MKMHYLLVIIACIGYGINFQASEPKQSQISFNTNTKPFGDGVYTVKDGTVIAFKDMKESSVLSKNVCKDVYNDLYDNLFKNPNHSNLKKAGYMIGDVGLAFGSLYTTSYLVHGNWVEAGTSLLVTALSAGLCIIGLQNEAPIYQPVKAELSIKAALFFAAAGLTSRLSPGK